MGRPLGSINKKHIAKISLVCIVCDKEFKRFPSEVIKPNQGRFCSRRVGIGKHAI